MYSIRTVTVKDREMEVFLFEPSPPGPHPGIVLAQHIPIGHTGVENDTFTLKFAERLAANGYAVAVPFIFHWWPKDASIEIKRAESRDDWMVADMEAALSLLESLDHVSSNRIGVVGHCWGGRVSWLGACHIPAFKACATFYGGRIKIAMGGDHPAPITLASNIKCPLMGFYGNEDSNPSPVDVDDYIEALEMAGVEHTMHRYDDAGHAFQSFTNPERYREQQSEDAWSKLLDFLKETLKP